MNTSTRTERTQTSPTIGPLSAALFGGYATGTVIMLLLWHLI